MPACPNMSQHVPTCPNGRAQQDEGERHAYENTNPKCFKCVQALSQNCRTPQKVKACLWDSIQFHGQPSVRFPHLQPQASSGTPPNVPMYGPSPVLLCPWLFCRGGIHNDFVSCLTASINPGISVCSVPHAYQPKKHAKRVSNDMQ